MTWKDGAINRRAKLIQKIDDLQEQIDELQGQILPRQKRKRSLVIKQGKYQKRWDALNEIIAEEA